MSERRPFDQTRYENELEFLQVLTPMGADEARRNIEHCESQLEDTDNNLADEHANERQRSDDQDYHDRLMAYIQHAHQCLAAHTAQAITSQSSTQLVQPAKAVHEITPGQETEHG